MWCAPIPVVGTPAATGSETSEADGLIRTAVEGVAMARKTLGAKSPQIRYVEEGLGELEC